MSKENSFNEWALVELFGHQKIVGKVTEATMAGGAFLRVDVPAFDHQPTFTRFYGPGAIYSISPVTEDIARGLMERYRNEPVSRFELPQIAEHVTSSRERPRRNGRGRNRS
jgi:hypothetical protein